MYSNWILGINCCTPEHVPNDKLSAQQYKTLSGGSSKSSVNVKKTAWKMFGSFMLNALYLCNLEGMDLKEDLSDSWRVAYRFG